MAEAPAIGIDLGTAYSCVAVFHRGRVEIIANDRGSKITPSYVSFVGDELLIGNSAKDQATTNLTNTIFDAKRLIGRKFSDRTVQEDMKNWPFRVVNYKTHPKFKVEIEGETKTYYPEEISAMILGKMKETAEAYLGKPVKKAVITVPAYFNDCQRQATKDAATIAGLKVLRIINEPTAAAIAYGIGIKESIERIVLVFDFGGGTFDVSILNMKDCVFEVLSTAGNTHLGGEDFNNRLVNYFMEEFLRQHNEDISEDEKALNQLRIACEQVKRNLTSVEQTTIDIESLYKGINFSTSISRAQFEELNADIFRILMETVEKAICDAEMEKYDIDEVVLVGGSTRIPKVQKLLLDFFDGKELNKSIDPHEAVAYGAAIQAAILNGGQYKKGKNMVLIDVTPLSLSTDVELNDVDLMIKRNSTIPTKVTRSFTTVKDNQTSVPVKILEGEFYQADRNDLLGEFIFEGIPPADAEKPIIHVTFEIDVNGILKASAIDIETKKEKEISISYNKNRLSEEEIERIIEDAREYYVNKEKLESTLAAKHSLETYCIRMKNSVGNEKLSSNISPCDKKLILRKCDETIKWLKWRKMSGKYEFEVKLKELEVAFDLIISLAEQQRKKKEIYQKILNVDEGASQEGIRNAYRRETLKYHPDVFNGDVDIGTWMFRTLTAAKTFLLALAKRASNDNPCEPMENEDFVMV